MDAQPRGPHDWNNTMSLREDLVRFEDGQIVLRGIVKADTLVYQTVHSAYSLNGHDETPPHYTTVGIDPERDQFPFAGLPFYFILSNQVGGNWVGPVAEEDLPTELRIDWVKVWVPAPSI